MAVSLENIDGLRILRWPEPVLARRCEGIDPQNPLGEGWFVDKVASKMLELMRQAGGLGLAAPQVGLPIRMFVWSVDGDDGVAVNPILSDPTGEDTLIEGCLSLPGVCIDVRRHVGISMSSMSVSGDPLPHRRARGLLARVWQHECDHLDGVTLVQRMSASDKVGNRAAMRSLRVKARRAERKRKGR